MTAQASISNARLIYTAARKLADEEAQQAYLDSVCGNDVALRQQVEALLAANRRNTDNPLEQAADAVLREAEGSPGEGGATERFLEKPGGVAAQPKDDVGQNGPLDVSCQPQIGPYRVRELLGEGGMGFVYVAEQTHPVQRKVALKVIKPGMDTRDVIARFEAERQALAMMSHPNIAKVLDGGTTDEGRPYFVMELVRGMPITQFCDQQKLSTRDRLQLFLPVCQAVQHAHMKGIIHRDLKPSNVIVELDDVRPIPKVIDFGVAKATGQRLSEQTVYTQFAQLVGTPMYMSPEQAKQSSTDIDTRSDIYSLGVLLYELLTGTTPFDSQTLSSVDATELRRIICEDEPPRPSARISTLQNEQLTTITSCHRTQPRELSLTLQRELDWIVMKALEKDRMRRYDSASALAGDIQRYLAGEEVQACPPTWGYRLKKFTTRHKGLLTTAALLLGMLVTSTIISATFAVQAGQARDAAETSADEAGEQKEAAVAARQLANKRLVREQQARREAEDERQRSQQNYLQARQAVDQMLTRVADEHLSQFPEMAEIRRKLLTDAASFYT